MSDLGSNTLRNKTAEAKSIKIISEALKEAAGNISTSRKTLAEADKYLLEQLISGSGIVTEEGKKKALEILKDLLLYEMLEKKPAGDTIYVIPRGSEQNLTLPAPSRPSKDKNDAKNEPVYPSYQQNQSIQNPPNI